MTELLPILPLQTVIFPGMRAPLSIFEERYRRMLDDHPGSDPAFGVVLLRSGRDTDPTLHQDTYPIGTAMRIISRQSRPGGGWKLIVEGTRRFSVLDRKSVNGYGLATVSWLVEDREPTTLPDDVLRDTLAAYRRFVGAVTAATDQPFPGVRISDDPLAAAWDLASRLPMTNRERQQLLETDGLDERFTLLRHVIRREVSLIESLGLVGVPLEYAGGSVSVN